MNPYEALLGLPPSDAAPDHYLLLGLPQFASDPVTIRKAAVERSSQLRKWDNSRHYREADRLLDEVVAASEVLEDPARKAVYDAQLRLAAGRLGAVSQVELRPTKEIATSPVVPISVRPVGPTEQQTTSQAASDDSATNYDRLFLSIAAGLLAVALLIIVPVLMLSGRRQVPEKLALATPDANDPNGNRTTPNAENVALTKANSEKPTAVETLLQPEGVPTAARMKMIAIAPGTFTMGSQDDGAGKDETPHEVTISRPYFIGAHEVTIGQVLLWLNSPDVKFDRAWIVLAEPDCPIRRQGNGFELNTDTKLGKFLDQPMVFISWTGAVAFCEWCSKQDSGFEYRLPTEAEWEYAARAGSTTPYPWGSTLNGREANVHGSAPHGTSTKGPFVGSTKPVGSYRPNAWGLYDTSGNVGELCSDVYDRDYYTHSPKVDPKGPPGDLYRVCRPGKWSYPAVRARSSARSSAMEGLCTMDVGFRVVADLKQATSESKLTSLPSSGPLDDFLSGKGLDTKPNSVATPGAQPSPEPQARRQEIEPEPPAEPPEPKVPKNATKGKSFYVWSEPSPPIAGISFEIVILIRVPAGTKSYNQRDLSGMITGSDNYKQVIKMTKSIPVENGFAENRIRVPGANRGVTTSVRIQSKMTGETLDVQLN